MSLTSMTVADTERITSVLGNTSATIFRSYVMSEMDKETASPSIVANLCTSVYGNIVVFDVVYPDHERYLLLSGDTFGSLWITLVHRGANGEPSDANEELDSEKMEYEPVLVVNNADGLAVVTCDDVLAAISENCHFVSSVTINGYWAMNDYYNNNADRVSIEKPSLRNGIGDGVLVVENEEGELFTLTYDDLVGVDDVEPTYIGSPDIIPSNTRIVVNPQDGTRSIYDANTHNPYRDSYLCFPDRYGRKSVDVDMFQHNDPIRSTIERVNADNIDIEITSFATGAIVIRNRNKEFLDPKNDPSVTFYLHGGPEFYMDYVTDLIAESPVLADLVAKNHNVVIPLISHSTDFIEPEKFATGQHDSLILGKDGVEIEMIVSTIELLHEEELWSKITVYAESMGCYLALAMIAFKHPEHLSMIDKFILKSPLASTDDVLEEENFTVQQKFGLRTALQEDLNPFEFIGSEEWVQLNHSMEHASVSIIIGHNDEICSVDTAYELQEKLSTGDYQTSLFIDEYSDGHDLSSGAELYTMSQF